jgi:hypothetical protein
MPYDRKIAHLEETHTMLEQELKTAEEHNAADNVIQELKKKKLHAKDMLTKLKALDNAGREFQ